MLESFLALIRSYFFSSFIHLLLSKCKNKSAKKRAGSDPTEIPIINQKILGLTVKQKFKRREATVSFICYLSRHITLSLTFFTQRTPWLLTQSIKLLSTIRSLPCGNLVYKVEKSKFEIEVAFLRLFNLLIASITGL